MKFWFCEKCGKRLTEEDLAEGQGRDKKLNGVFCSQCSIGVMTMETLPITETEARKLLGKPDTGAAKPSPKRGSGVVKAHQPARTRLSNPELPGHAQRPVASRGPSRLAIVAVSAGMVLGLAALLLLANREKPRADAKAALPQPSPALPVQAEPSKTVMEHDPPKSDPALRKFESNPIAPVSPLPQSTVPADLAASEQVASMPAPISQAPPTTEMSSQPASAIPVVPAPLPADPAAEAAAAYAAFTDQYLDLLRKRDRKGAEMLADRAEKDPVLRPQAAAIGQDRRMVNWLSDLENSFLKGVEKLKQVDEFELKITKGESLQVGKRAKYQVVEIRADALEIGAKGMSFSLPFSKFSSETLGNLEVLGLSDDGAGLLRKAFAYLLNPDALKGAETSGAAKAALERARKAGASAEEVEYLLGKVDAFARGAREAHAEQELAKFDRHCAAREWALAERVGTKLLAEYGACAAVKGRAALREQVATAARNGAPLVEYALTFQEGAAIPELGLAQYQGVREANLYVAPANADNHTDVDQNLVGADGGRHKFLIGFTLFDYEGGPLPASAEVLDAKFLMYSQDAFGIVEYRQVLSPWKASEAAWNFAMRGKHWKPGGDVVEKASFQVSMPEKGWVEADCTESLRGLHKQKQNFGWQVDVYATNEKVYYASSLNFHSSRNKDTATRPKLILKIRCPKIVQAPRNAP